MTIKQITREVSGVTYICDKCGEEIKYDFFLPSPCYVCRRHFHRSCSAQEEDDYGIYCEWCWTIGEPFRKRIEGNERTIDREREEWYRLAKESVK